MRALRRILITLAIVVGLAVLIIAAGAAWLNSYIHSDAFKTEVESRAAESIGGTVHIDKVDFDIFNGVKLQGLVSQIDPAHDGGQGALQVKVASVHCAYNWKELLGRRLELTGITLDQPQIVLTKQPPAAPVPAQPLPGGPDSGGMQGEGTAMPFKFVLDRARIKDGSVSVLDATGATMVTLQGIDLDANTAGVVLAKDITGTVKIADILVQQSWHLTNFSAPFSFDTNETGLALKSFEASAYGGNLGGDFVPPSSGIAPLNLNGNGLDVAQLTASATTGSSTKVTGAFDFQSKWRGVEAGTVDGEGDAQITNGKLAGVKLLQDIGNILKIKELNEPIIKKGQTHFTVHDKTTLTGLQIESSIFNITGGGTIGTDGKMQLDLVLILNRDAMNKLPSQVAASFVKQPDGTGTIGFQVTGSTNDPQTNLPERLLVQNTQIQNVLNKALNKLFH